MKRNPMLDASRDALVRTIGRWTRGSGDFATPMPDLGLFRREQPTPPGMCLVEPSVVLVVQGVKRMLVADDAYAYDSNRFLLASLDIPASSQVLVASPKRPCLGLVLKLDLRLLAELGAQMRPRSLRSTPIRRGMALGTVTQELLEAFVRLTNLLEERESIDVLAPLVQREIHFRLLMSDQSDRLRQLAAIGSQSHVVAGAIAWLKAHYTGPIRVRELAERVNMSPSTLHHHFRQLTAMSPLQYQKWLRLNAARRLMLNDGFDAARAAFEVGYESASQFSREYARQFGAPPRRDVVKLRSRAAAPGSQSATFG